MLNGFCLTVRDYKAEIIEFNTLSIIDVPDGSKLYLIQTKYGQDYVNEKDISPTREVFEKECEELNKSLEKIRENLDSGSTKRGVRYQRPKW